jgi:hypothetical protein
MGCSKNRSKIGNMVIEYCCDELLAFVRGRKGLAAILLRFAVGKVDIKLGKNTEWPPEFCRVIRRGNRQDMTDLC